MWFLIKDRGVYDGEFRKDVERVAGTVGHYQSSRLHTTFASKRYSAITP